MENTFGQLFKLFVYLKYYIYFKALLKRVSLNVILNKLNNNLKICKLIYSFFLLFAG